MTTQATPFELGYDLPAEVVERTAKAIGRARILADYPPPEPTISVEGYALYWDQESSEYRTRFRRQAVAALRASELLQRVSELEQAINTARSHLHDLDYQSVSVAAAEQVLNRATEPKN